MCRSEIQQLAFPSIKAASCYRWETVKWEIEGVMYSDQPWHKHVKRAFLVPPSPKLTIQDYRFRRIAGEEQIALYSPSRANCKI